MINDDDKCNNEINWNKEIEQQRKKKELNMKFNI